MEVSTLTIKCLSDGNKIIFAGNGGSAADSQHIAAEFVSKLNFDRPALSSIALTTDTSILTAIGNDYGFENLFSRQINAIANKGDIFVGITTSGKSNNIIKAFSEAKKKGVICVGLTGYNDFLNKFCDYVIKVPSNSTPFIQESHITIGHILCDIVETSLFSND